MTTSLRLIGPRGSEVIHPRRGSDADKLAEVIQEAIRTGTKVTVRVAASESANEPSGVEPYVERVIDGSKLTGVQIMRGPA